MKKFLSGLILIGFLAVVLVPTIASAVEVKMADKCTMKRALIIGEGTDRIDCGAKGAQIDIDDPQKAVCCVMNTLYNVTDGIFVVLVALAGIFVVIGALMLIMSAGDPQKTTSGRQYILWAAIGLIAGLLAKAIPSIVRMIGAI